MPYVCSSLQMNVIISTGLPHISNFLKFDQCVRNGVTCGP